VQVTGFDHLVLAVADVERSLAWYTGVLGLAGERVAEWRRG
jgi:catechol 2,3-dioxygenase-like lactoylglutathione lyase family enzyme